MKHVIDIDWWDFGTHIKFSRDARFQGSISSAARDMAGSSVFGSSHGFLERSVVRSVLNRILWQFYGNLQRNSIGLCCQRHVFSCLLLI